MKNFSPIFLSLLLYSLCIFWRIEDFPIYFFCDEAYHPLLGEQLYQQGLRDNQGTFFPVYFDAAAGRWTPDIGVYVHGLARLAAGPSIAVTRGVAAGITVLGMLALTLLLQIVFNARFAWTIPLLLASSSAWFLHARTAFETTFTAAALAGFLLFYLLYRTRSSAWAPAALLLWALGFYSYSNAQLAFGVSALLLLISDLRYHWQQRRKLLPALLLLVVVSLPLLFFVADHGGAFGQHLKTVSAHKATGAWDSLRNFAENYSLAFSPWYWFGPNEQELVRHRMLGYPFLPRIILPFTLLGLVLCVWRVRKSEYRAILLVMSTIPLSSALAGLAITRILSLVLFAAVFTCIALEFLDAQLRRWIAAPLLPALAAIALSASTVAIARDALTNGRRWFSDYGLYGLAYGAKQLFTEAFPAYWAKHPDAKFVVSPNWANAPERFASFFLGKDSTDRVSFMGPDSLLRSKHTLAGNEVFVVTASEYGHILRSGKFSKIKIVKKIPYPDGSDGFYFLRLQYASGIDRMFAEEREKRTQLLEAEVKLGKEKALVKYSLLDMGSAQSMFDDDPDTLARGMEANPFRLEVVFSKPQTIRRIRAKLASINLEWQLMLYTKGTAEGIPFQQAYPSADTYTFDLGVDEVERLAMSFRNRDLSEIANIHIYEIGFEE